MKMWIVCVAAVLMATCSYGELLLGWDFAGYLGNEASGTNVFAATNIETPALIIRGSGVNASGSTNSFSANNWTEASLADAITANDYFEWSISATAGNTITITNWNALFYRSSTSASNWTLRASTDGFTFDLASYTLTGTTQNVLSDVMNLTASSITFRLYGWGGSNPSGTGRFSGANNELELYGTVSAIPEPATLSFMGFGLIAAFMARRCIIKA